MVSAKLASTYPPLSNPTVTERCIRPTEGLSIEVESIIAPNSDCYCLTVGMISARCDCAVKGVVLFAVENNLFLDARANRISLYRIARCWSLCTPLIDPASKVSVTILFNGEDIAVTIPRTDKVAVVQAKRWGVDLQNVWGNARHVEDNSSDSDKQNWCSNAYDLDG